MRASPNRGLAWKFPTLLAGRATECSGNCYVVEGRRDFRASPNATDQSGIRRTSAFSLLEVVAAISIFAIGMIAVLGIYGPVTKSVAAVSDAEASARVADAVRARLSTLPFDTALALVQEVAEVRKKDGDGAYNPNDGTKYPAVMFGKLDGEVGIYDAGTSRKQWYDSRIPSQRVLDADKFFEIDLIRSDALSPKSADATAAMVAFTIRVRWPAFVLTSPTTAVQSGQNPAGGSVTYDHGRKQVLFYTGSISR